MSRQLFSFFFGAFLSVSSIAQSTVEYDENVLGQDGSRIISTAVPFLTISPDARAAGMADVGVATTGDANALYWNPGKLPFIEDESDPTGGTYDYGFSLSYTPWLRKLINDMSISYLAGYKKLRKEEVIGVSLLYFDLGSMTFRNGANEIIGEHNPREYAFNVTYARKLSQDMGLALGLKFIHSNLAGNVAIANTSTVTKPGNTAAADIGWYYRRNIDGLAFKAGLQGAEMALGANLSNVGAKISYTNNDQADFIPTNIRLGASFTGEIDAYNKITLAFDFNKLMVPTPPTYLVAASGQDSTNAQGDKVVDLGENPDRPFINGMFGSFTDAPGGFSEEIKEVVWAVGLEYWYYNLLAVRGGYYNEHQIKGNRKYFTLGMGVRYQVFGLDFAYLIPVQQNNPLQDTLRFTLLFNFKDTKPDADSQDSIAE